MSLFYILYALQLLILAPFLTIGTGCKGFLFFFTVSMAIPVVGPLLWAWLWSPGNKAQNICITIALHLFTLAIAVLWVFSAA